jgi:hypothetical protein
MKVSQRGTSFAAITSGTYSLDRWRFYNGDIGAYTVTQDSTGADGFANSFKIDCTTADASPAAGDYLILRYSFEGQDLQCWKKGTASAESVTLSFWVKSNKTGDLAIHLFDADNARGIGSTPTINSADTWEKKTITFAGDTTGAFNDDNAVSLYLDFWYDGGSTYTGGSTPTSWEAVAESDRGAGTTLALADSTSNYINITGVQLEVGSIATEFEHRSYGEELALCQRYYYLLVEGDNEEVCYGFYYNATSIYMDISFPVTMRVAPSLDYTTGSNYYEIYANGVADSFDTLAIQGAHPNGINAYNTNNVSGTAGHAGFIYTANANSRIAFEAEL